VERVEGDQAMQYSFLRYHLCIDEVKSSPRRGIYHSVSSSRLELFHTYACHDPIVHDEYALILG